VCPEQQAKIGWSRRGKAVVSKCLNGMACLEVSFVKGAERVEIWLNTKASEK
jgi:hypothetical protein